MKASLASVPVDARWHSQVAPFPIVVALVHRNAGGGEEYLLINRLTDPFAGLWALVGGKWDFGESLAEAVVREVQEETSLATEFVALRGVLSERVVPAEPGAVAAHFLLLLCDLQVIDGIAAEQAEGAVGWFSRAEIETLHEDSAIIPSDYAMIAAFAGARNASHVVEILMDASLDGPVRLTSFEHQHRRTD
jgi:ADP-ribose pyrophosphatase YjhB (NUDIX family)